MLGNLSAILGTFRAFGGPRTLQFVERIPPIANTARIVVFLSCCNLLHDLRITKFEEVFEFVLSRQSGNGMQSCSEMKYPPFR